MPVMCRNQKGWMLIDALIGLVVLAVALLAMASGFRQAVTGTVMAGNRTKAAYLAQQQLSDLRRYEHRGYDRSRVDIWNTSSAYSDPNPGSQLQFQFNSAVLETAQIPDGLDNDIIPVQAIVQWTDATGPQTFKVVTYYYK